MKWTNQLENLFRRKRTNDVNNRGKTESDNNFDQLTQFSINFNLRMLIIADAHGCLDSEDIPQDHNAVVCLLLGDLSKEDIMIIKENVVGIPIYGVLGNHDGFELYDRFGIENIHGKIVEVNGVRIAGIQGSLRYKYSDMPLYTDEESVEIAEKMEEADILISHDSPKYLHGDNDFAHSGLLGITCYCEKWNVPLNIHGHHHNNMRSVLENGTTSICCYGVRLIDTANIAKEND
jgi:Icc-related predicted phosphoesterase